MTPNEEKRKIVGELAGSASMCWNPRPEGVFDSTKALEFVDQALTALNALESREMMGEEELKDILDKPLNEALFYLGYIGSTLNKYDRTTIKNYIAKALSNRIPKMSRERLIEICEKWLAEEHEYDGDEEKPYDFNKLADAILGKEE